MEALILALQFWRTTVSFLLTAAATFAIVALLIVIYESWKPGGYDKKNGRLIVVYAVVVAVIVGLIRGGFWSASWWSMHW